MKPLKYNIIKIIKKVMVKKIYSKIKLLEVKIIYIIKSNN